MSSSPPVRYTGCPLNIVFFPYFFLNFLNSACSAAAHIERQKHTLVYSMTYHNPIKNYATIFSWEQGVRYELLGPREFGIQEARKYNLGKLYQRL